MKLSKVQAETIEDVLHVTSMAVGLGSYPRNIYLKLATAWARWNEQEDTSADRKLLTKVGNGGDIE